MDFMTVKDIAAEAVNSIKLIEQLVKRVKTEKDNKTDPEFCDLLYLLEGIISTEQDVGTDCIHKVLDEVCLPLLFKIHPSFDSNVENVALLTSVSSLCGACLLKAEETRVVDLIEQCLGILTSYSQGADWKSEDGEFMDIYCCVSVLQHVFKPRGNKFSSSIQKKLLQSYINVVQSIKCMQDNLLINMALNCLKNMMNICVNENFDKLSAVWELICKEFAEGNEKPYILLCGMASHFFPVVNDNVVFDLKCKDDFWRIVQQGVSRKVPSSRKQTMYLLKRVTDMCHSCNVGVQSETLFHWKPKDNLLEVWEDYILILETLEEKQVHIIKPVLPRLSKLIKATQIDQNGQGVLHSSWLTAIFRRLLMHENIFILRYTVDIILKLDFQCCPMLKQCQEKYLCEDFLLSLQEPKLFIRKEGAPAGSSLTCSEALAGFFQNCWHVLDNPSTQTSFFRRILTTIVENTWSPVPLLLIFEALSKTPAIPILDSAGLQDLKNGVSSETRTWDSFTRGAMLCFCGQILLNLINIEKVLPLEFFFTLTMFTRSESLCRGTCFWKEVSDWLKTVTNLGLRNWTADDIKSCIKNQTVKFLTIRDDNVSVTDEADVLMTIRLILLSVDADILPLKTSEQEIYSLTHTLQSLIKIINDFPTHPYMSSIKVEKALKLMVGLMAEVGDSEEDEVSQFIKTFMDTAAVSGTLFIQQQLTEGWKQMSDLPSMNLCCDALSLVMSKSCYADVGKAMKQLSMRCFHFLRTLKQDSVEQQIIRLGASMILGTIAQHVTDQKLLRHLLTQIQSASSFIPSTFVKPHSDTCISQKEWGRMASDFMTSQWKTVLFLLKNSKSCDSFVTMDKCLEYLSVSSGDATIIIFRCIKLLLPMKVDDGKLDTVVEVLKVSWAYLKEHQGKGTSYWHYLEAYTEMAFQKPLTTQSRDSPVTHKLLQIANDLLEIGEEKSGVVNVLLNRLIIDCPIPMENFLPVIVQCCMFGPVYKKQDKQLIDVFSYISSLGSKLSINQLQPWFPKNLMVKVRLVEFLCHLDPQNSLHYSFGNFLLSGICKKYQEMVTISSGNTYSNSLPHRQKNRLMQCVLLLEPFISQTESDKIFSLLLDFFGEEMQPSVRHYQEWACMRLIGRFPNLVSNLWSAFSVIQKKSTPGLSSLMLITSHIGPLQTTESQEKFYDTAISQILSLCLAHHFQTRIHALAVLSLLWDQCKRLNLQGVINRHSIIQVCFLQLAEDNNTAKNVKKLLENYFLANLDIHRDYSVETLFHTMPRLSLLFDDEWISPQYFNMYPKTSYIPLTNPDSTLAKCKEGAQSSKVQNDSEPEGTIGDIQKKIMPWRLMNPDDVNIEEMENPKHRRRSEGLILVTSLIDKVPNLGGLCRTSEIFGVSEFVLNKLAYVEDKVFQTLSVTAHKWLPIREVFYAHLPEYFQQKKSQGYTLVGVEQTANSVSLNDFKFPAKTLLLLGNEKEGIPADLISLLDVCVEIPQQGVIRSLNVHVSGAILVWEYRRQHMIKDKISASSS
ncbi:probable methyltransferase TARBP1 [Saccostrea echinata]|uniref:probable methyltransferase TARBP1 n=1 Tax=Saccostrea echinata TaxID=191078 RepID=UPI002A828A3E|nr:probable methyltransferase TARBP1 [Saccostrea echinata]